MNTELLLKCLIHLDKGRGLVSTVLVRQGTLKLNNFFVAGTTWGRIRGLIEPATGKAMTKAEPSCPVEVIGFKQKTLPQPGEDLLVVSNEQRVKEIVDYRKERQKLKDAHSATLVTPSSVVSADAAIGGESISISDVKAKDLNVIIKADVGGTLEAVEAAIKLLPRDEVQVRIVRGGVGSVSTSDISLAKDMQASVFLFNVAPTNDVQELARVEKVDISNFSIIYQLCDAVRAKMEAMLPPNEVEEVTGTAEVMSVFSITLPNKTQKKIAGMRITKGTIDRRLKTRVLRRTSVGRRSDDYDEEPMEVAFDGSMESLKRFKDDVLVAKKGDECGVAFAKWDDLRPGDVVLSYKIKQVPRKLAEPRHHQNNH